MSRLHQCQTEQDCPAFHRCCAAPGRTRHRTLKKLGCCARSGALEISPVPLLDHEPTGRNLKVRKVTGRAVVRSPSFSCPRPDGDPSRCPHLDAPHSRPGSARSPHPHACPETLRHCGPLRFPAFAFAATNLPHFLVHWGDDQMGRVAADTCRRHRRLCCIVRARRPGDSQQHC